ncbi:MAG: TIGR03960 family B12-binding radical SAM protein [Bacillota bacterium]|nr:TIGR03960 family B12-binding radical SAM protein [Bacillota bacterium]
MLEIEHLLPKVEKPARYVGGEYNAVVKDWDRAAVKVAFAFPDVYEVGMSHLGLQILYHVVNSREDALMERVFAPWTDMEGLMREEGIPLFSLESRRSVRDFDILAFTLQYELSFSNVLNMLDLGGIPLRAADRREGMPLVIAGGPCAFNPEPLADFLDAVFLGEAEDGFGELIEVCRQARAAGVDRQGLLRALAQVPGVYVPSFYRVAYDSAGRVREITPADESAPERVVKRVVDDLDRVPYPTRPLVPSTAVVHDRAVLEVFRGCSRGCRFCQAGMIYRPVRERDPERLLEQADEILRHTGYGELSLASLSTTDYSAIRPLVEKLVERYAGERVGLALPSTRVDAFAVDLARLIQKVRKSSLTFAPEAGTQRLRNVINKQVTEEDLLATARAAFEAGWLRIKLYFMLGLPTETLEDVEGINLLARRVLAVGDETGVPKGRLSITTSVSTFVPKAHTPFQWEPFLYLDEVRERQAYLKRRLKGRGLVFHWHDPEASFLEAVFSRGDRRLGAALERAWQLGARLDGWREHFRPDLWRQAFADVGLVPEDYAYRRYAYEDILPWGHLDAGVSKRFLALEHKRALAGETTADCRAGRCTGCGLCPALEVEPRLPQRVAIDAAH